MGEDLAMRYREVERTRARGQAALFCALVRPFLRFWANLWLSTWAD